MSTALHKATARKSLTPRKEPYWGPPIAQGQYLGYRKIDTDAATWVARFRLDTGKQSYQALGPDTASFGYAEALEAAKQWCRLKEHGGLSGNVVTVTDACRRYVTEREQSKGRQCAHDADKRFERCVYDQPLGDTNLRKVSSQLLLAWRHALNLSPGSANRTMIAVKAALYLAVREKNAPDFLWRELRNVKPLPGGNGRRTVFLDLEQRRALISAADGAVKDLIISAAMTGARPGELVNARRQQFEARTRTLLVRGKTGSRQVPLSAAAVEHFKRLSESKLPAAFLHVRDDGKPWGHSDYDELVKAAVSKAELPAETVLYTLRHSWITEALMAGMPTYEVAAMVGTSIVMIQKHYGHVHALAARERLDQVQML